MGSIQPARYLSHTGRVLPGVRRIVNVPKPPAGDDWIMTVPGGEMWRIISGYAELAVADDGGSEVSVWTLTVDGEVIWNAVVGEGVSASETVPYVFAQQAAALQGTPFTGSTTGFNIAVPDFPMPEGTTFGPITAGIQADDQWQNIHAYVERTYVTDSQLSDIENTYEVAERKLEKELSQTTLGSN